MKVEFESPAVAEAAKSGEKLFTIVDSAHEGTCSRMADLQITYPTLSTMPTENLPAVPISRNIDATSLQSQKGLFKHAILKMPFDADRAKFTKLHGPYHGDNITKSYVRVPGSTDVMIKADTIMHMALPKLMGSDGKPVPYTDSHAGTRIIPDSHLPALEKFARDLLAAHLRFHDVLKMEAEVRIP